MKLVDYMIEKKLTDEAFGALVKRDRTRVLRWRSGKSWPDPEALEAIREVTGGKVTANDFFHPVEVA